MGDAFLVSPGERNNLPLAKDNMSPRFGIAYSLSSTTVVRSGYGILWIPDYMSYALNPNNDMVNAASTTYTGTVDGIHPYNTISLPFPNGISPPPVLRWELRARNSFLPRWCNRSPRLTAATTPRIYPAMEP